MPAVLMTCLLKAKFRYSKVAGITVKLIFDTSFANIGLFCC